MIIIKKNAKIVIPKSKIVGTFLENELNTNDDNHIKVAQYK